MDLISIIGFFQALKLVSDNNGISEEAIAWLVPLFTKKSEAVAFTEPLSLTARSLHGSIEEGTLPSYVQAVNHLSRLMQRGITLQKHIKTIYALPMRQVYLHHNFQIPQG